MTDEEIQKRIKLDEGYRGNVYLDSQGIPTVGWGHALLHGSPITLEIAELLFEMDWNEAVKGYNSYVAKHGILLNTVRRGVIINMIYNMGLSNLRGFKKMTRCLIKEDYEGAADQMLDSLWAQQVKRRANRLAQMMRTGELP